MGEPTRAPDSASNWRGCRSAASRYPQNKRCRMLESNQHLAIIDRGLDLRANPAWCAVRESNPHLLVVGQPFLSVELPARKLGERTVSAVARELSLCPLINGGGYRSRTCLAALIWRRSAYKALPLPEDPLLKTKHSNFGPSGMNRTSVGRI